MWEYNVVVTTTPDQGCGDLDLGLRDTGDEIVAIWWWAKEVTWFHWESGICKRRERKKWDKREEKGRFHGAVVDGIDGDEGGGSGNRFVVMEGHKMDDTDNHNVPYVIFVLKVD